MNRPAAALSFFLFTAFPAWAGVEIPPEWDKPKPVTEKTAFFGETERTTAQERGQPSVSDKSYGWYWLEHGNNYLAAGRIEKAAPAFEKAYRHSATARIPAGFKLVEAYESMGRLDPALETLDQMKREYLISNSDHAQARVIASRLLDQKRKTAEAAKVPKAYDGRAWVLQTQEERMRYVLDAMQELRTHGVPLAMSAHKYAFLLDEYFLAHPAAPAVDGAHVLSLIVYEQDPAARIAVDRWRIDPSSTEVERSVKTDHPKFTGAQWLTLTHEQKMNYVQGAMEVLRGQHVPMKRTPYAYAFAIDEMFTEDPDLPAADSVVALASLLFRTEPEAKEVLEALRLR